VPDIAFACARGQAADDVALEQDSDDHERGDRRGRQRRHRPPVDALRAGLARHHDGQGLRVRAREQCGEEVLVPAQYQREDEGRHHSRHGERQHDPEEGAPDRQAIHEGGFIEFDRDRVELIAHDPDDDRKRRQGVEQDQPQSRVEQRQRLVEDQERQGQHDGRQDQLRHEEEQDIVVAHPSEPKSEAAQPVSSQ